MLIFYLTYMEEINFIKWKAIGTKSIQDWIVTCYFEVSVSLYKKLDAYHDSVLTLLFKHPSLQDIELNATFNKDGNNWLSFQGDHGMIKLDINLEDKFFVGYILTSNVFLKLW